MIFCVGDVHGNTASFERTATRLRGSHPGCVVIQVGDMGVGFAGVRAPECPEGVHWISGNHDDHRACLDVPGYLGDFGVREWHGAKVFFLRGAYSHDVAMRVPGISWWEYEELSLKELAIAREVYREHRPDVVVTHDCPLPIRERWFRLGGLGSRTNQALTAMFEDHEPAVWAFGHHHRQLHGRFGATTFVCCGELQEKRVWPPPREKEES